MAAVVFCDFEFQPETRRVLVGCFLDGADMRRTTIDFRAPSGAEELRRYVAARPDHTWAAYAAQAEMSCLLWLGLDIRPMQWIDLMAELHMVCGTTSAFFLRRPSLLGHMGVLGIAPGHLRIPAGRTPEQHKEAMRDLILSRSSWTDEEWADIIEYCWSDVLPLVDMLEWVNTYHDARGTRAAGVWDGEIAALRGEYLKASAILANRSAGIPVDAGWLRDIFRHRAAVRNALAERCNAHYGHDIYRQKRTVVSIDPVTRVRRYEIGYSFHHAGLEAYLRTQPFYDEWERTNAGRRKLEDSYLDDLIKAFPVLGGGTCGVLAAGRTQQDRLPPLRALPPGGAGEGARAGARRRRSTSGASGRRRCDPARPAGGGRSSYGTGRCRSRTAPARGPLPAKGNASTFAPLGLKPMGLAPAMRS